MTDQSLPDCTQDYIRAVKTLFTTFSNTCVSEGLSAAEIYSGVDALFYQTIEQVMRDLIEFQNEYKKMSEELELKTKELDAKIKELQKFIDDEGAGEEWKK